jgi:hypothetical protein
MVFGNLFQQDQSQKRTKMNERIKTIAKEAGFIASAPTLSPTLEKFAELIVKECAGVSQNYACGSMPLSIALAIKEHFGVEE